MGFWTSTNKMLFFLIHELVKAPKDLEKAYIKRS